MLDVLGVLQNSASMDIYFNTDQVYDMLIVKKSPQPLWSAMIG